MTLIFFFGGGGGGEEVRWKTVRTYGKILATPLSIRELQEILANDFQFDPHEVPSKAAIARLFRKLINNAQEMCSRR